MLQELCPSGMNYVTLDDFKLAEQARRDPMGFLQEYREPLFIDEVQYAPVVFCTAEQPYTLADGIRAFPISLL